MAEAKYKQIFNIIKKRIKDGTYQNGKAIPDQNALANEFNASRMTVKKALDMLSYEGFLYSKRGSGTYVRQNAADQRDTLPFNEYAGLTKELGEKIESQVVKFDVVFPTKTLQDKLKVKSTDPIYEIKRLRIVEGEPYVFEHTFLSARLVPGLNENILHHSLYEYIQKDLKLKIGSAFRRISAEKTNEDDLKYLKSKKNDPILQIQQTVYLENGEPLEFSTNRHPYNGKHAYTILDMKK